MAEPATALPSLRRTSTTRPCSPTPSARLGESASRAALQHGGDRRGHGGLDYRGRRRRSGREGGVDRARADGWGLPQHRLRTLQGVAPIGAGTGRRARRVRVRRGGCGRSRRRFSRRDGADAPPARRTQRQGFGGALSATLASMSLSARAASRAATRSRSAGQTLRWRRAAIATGTRAAAPPIPGLAEAGYLTNETVFSLTALPAA